MAQNELFLKNREIIGNEIELIFHRDYTWIHSTEPLPVVKYRLVGCKNMEALDWALLDLYNDGVVVTSIPNGSLYLFQTTDMGGVKFEIQCERIIQEESAYSTDDLTEFLKDAKRQLDNEAIFVNRLQETINALSHFLEKELEINNRKLDQADWLTEAKKQFLHGQNMIIEHLLDQIKRK
ncbi:MAG TPA: hypothetical protein VNU72_03565 [Puia sp.]|jgi:hypothetical protein|nr:hypothetical protein [Puia sp.]